MEYTGAHENDPPPVARHGVSFYINGHDHNAQHLNDGSLVEYFVIGAGAPVDPSQGHQDNVSDRAEPGGAMFCVRGP